MAESKVCDICGHEILVDESFYEMPDGLTVCDEYDCLREWAKEYRRHA